MAKNEWIKVCPMCEKMFLTNSRNTRYCPVCAEEMARISHIERSQRYRDKQKGKTSDDTD